MIPTAVVTLQNRTTHLDFEIFLNPTPAVQNIKVTEFPSLLPKTRIMAPPLPSSRHKELPTNGEFPMLRSQLCTDPISSLATTNPRAFPGYSASADGQRRKGSILLGMSHWCGTHWNQCSQGRESYLGFLLFRISLQSLSWYLGSFLGLQLNTALTKRQNRGGND